MAQESFAMQFHEPQLRRLHALAELGEPLVTDELDSPEVRRRLRDVDVLMTSWGCPRLTAERLAAAPRLSAVFHAAGTVRDLVSDDVWRRDILVTNAADDNAIPVAEFTLAAIIFAGKGAPFLAQHVRTHRDDWSGIDRAALSNRGGTIGVVGYSRTGRRVVERLRSLDVDVLVADPYVSEADVTTAGARLVELSDLLLACDILTLHVPALPSTRHLVGATELSLLRDGATVINTARGAVLDTEALEKECAAGRLHAILDVTEPEPLPASSVLYELPNVMITPHIAGSLGSETQRMSDSALDELERFVSGQPARASVDPSELEASA
ncbi:hydroxyacid dehydrogenase [Actinobacteria bacterium YIM 96077]|uniref:Hydroxyacid dehydrogenase n=2 Tax=Phytoactinopolyspora halophila TaxID=1981511 RepID=A0A329QVL4_9ACTN|nr:hydroxyacid dehydrogenase [Actinobacteria bacterium YIM 96077]RAW15709.1 hydroxyacid dehydrogenase [Phytoactinopolyspora halophila]